MTPLRACAAAAAFASAFACMPAAAAPVTILAGESKSFVFNATALMPYSRVSFVTGFNEYDGQPQPGAFIAFGAPTGGNAFGCTASTSLVVCVSPFESFFADAPYPGFLDGDFTLTVRNDGTGDAKFSVDPYAKVFATRDSTEFTRVDPVGAVPEPSALALFAAGLAGLAFSRRRKA